MNSKKFFTYAALTSLCCIYFIRLNKQAQDYALSDIDRKENVIGENPDTNQDCPVDLLEAKLEPDMNKIKTKRTNLVIAGSEDNMIYGKKGTGLYFPANSFVDENGSAVNGKINIRLEECYDVSEMLLAKLSTTSDGKILETAGMVNIKAFSGNKELKLRDTAKYNIYFPKNKNDKDDFELFYGEWKDDDQINWKLANNTEPVEVLKGDDKTVKSTPALEASLNSEKPAFTESTGTWKSVLRDDENCFIRICVSNLRRGTKISEMDYFNWKLKDGQTLNQWFVSGFNPSLEMLEDFCVMNLRSEITFKVDKEGAFESYYISNSANPEYDRAIVSFLKTMPALDLDQLMPKYTDDHACIITFGTQEGTEAERFVSEFRKDHKDAIKDPLKNVEAATLDYFIFSSSELGWINCDRFLDNEGPTIDYVVENPGTFQGSVSMVFEDISSVLKGVNEHGFIAFNDVPAGQKIRLVGIDNPGNNPLMCVVKANTNDKKTKLELYKPFTLPELEQQFSKN